jgi:hypothetical protein
MQSMGPASILGAPPVPVMPPAPVAPPVPVVPPAPGLPPLPLMPPAPVMGVPPVPIDPRDRPTRINTTPVATSAPPPTNAIAPAFR